MKSYFVYLLSNKSNSVIYCGITNDLKRRVLEHKEKLNSSFTSKYNCNKLVYWESHDSPEKAISREKQIKSGSRKKKIAIIEKVPSAIHADGT